MTSIARQGPSVLAAWLVLGLLAGCAGQAVPREHGLALRDAEIRSTWLGQWARQAAADHAGLSGFALLAKAEEAFALRANLVEQASKRLDVQTYLLGEGQTVQVLLHRMIGAAQRGVEVRLLLDDLTASGQGDQLAALDSHPNIQVRVFNPWPLGREHLVSRVVLSLPALARQHRRMHNKTWIVDNAVAITGGRNLDDEYFNASEPRNFADVDLLAVGDVVDALSLSFDLYWNHFLSQPLARYHAAAPEAWRELATSLARQLAEQRDSDSPYFVALRARYGAAAEDTLFGDLHWAPGQALWDPPGKVAGRERSPLEETLFGALLDQLPKLESRLVIVSAYFVPAERGTALLTRLAESGIRVEVITNSLEATDLSLVHGAYAGRRRALLESGVRLHELRGRQQHGEEAEIGIPGTSLSSLHSKAVSFDDDLVFIGSFNADPRSVIWNTEIGVLVESEPLVAEFLEFAEAGMTPSLSYLPGLDGTGRLYWLTELDDRLVRLDREPGSLKQRLGSWLSRLLGLEIWL
ncbi:phospholipase D family protein [Halomonas maura]|uniref:phospholipase D family protein n=1 Tax=Halomonas maura TaxID=117606 RepID=UPI0025B3C861|nr:phospholipase D family protein [Halomonas maura]MDN3557178.1 phospholipase D family protein [Halomonas maura]